jgi:hypothetical protein
MVRFHPTRISRRIRPDFAEVVDTVAADCEAYIPVAAFGFLGSDFGHDSYVGGFATGRQYCAANEVDCVMAGFHVGQRVLG